ncbi:MAG: peptidoglycan editing factor PgeF [Chloroflexota bacterium]
MTTHTHQSDQIRYLNSELLPDELVTHAFFTRQGGVSTGALASLNVGLTVGDHAENVYHNRALAFNAVGRQPESLSDSWLVHGTDAVVYQQPRSPAQKTPPQADIVLTDNPEVTLFMRYADCVPIVLVDPVRRAIALVHAGWQGTIKKAAQAGVSQLTENYSSRPQDVLAVIGPSIGPENYEVGPEVITGVKRAFGDVADQLLPAYGKSTHFDLWAANQLVLQQAGVEQIDLFEICTFAHAAEWFSHRASGGKTGRFGVLLALKD